MRGNSTQTADPNQVEPGQYFDFPGFPGGGTQWVEEDETTTNQLTTHSSTNQQPISGILPFQQTDVATDWMLALAVSQTYTVGNSAFTASAYAPMVLFGQVTLKIQNQYSSVDVESGIDWYIFNLIRPYNNSEVLTGVNNGYNPAGDPVQGTATGYPTTAIAQPNNMYGAAAWSTGAATYNLLLRIPAAQWFDEYYDLALTGEATMAPHQALVSPQFMAGTTRNIIPKIMINPGNAATTDLGPVNISAGTGTYVGSSTARFRRRAVYAADPSVLPPIYAWQYSWKTTRFNVPGQSKVVLNMPPDTGQILSTYVRMFDPSAAGALGAPNALSTLTDIKFIYGSGLTWWNSGNDGTTTPAELIQRRWYQTHAAVLPPGVFALDFALDERGQVSNKRCLNTLTTGGILWRYSLSAPLSATAYAVLGTESLVYVS